MLCSSYSSEESSADSDSLHGGSSGGGRRREVTRCPSAGADSIVATTLSPKASATSAAIIASLPPIAAAAVAAAAAAANTGDAPARDVVRPWHVFTEEDKALLRHSWSPILAHLEEFGVEIYEMIFQQCPEARVLFPFMENVGAKKGHKKYSTEFRFQALRFVQILESGVNALDDLSSMDLLLHNLGRRHGKLDATNIFRSYYWSVFLECAIHKLRVYISTRMRRATGTLTDDEDINRAIVLWRRLLEGIIQRIEAGFIVDIANRRSSAKQRGASNPKWKYTDSTRAGWITASDTLQKSVDGLMGFSPFKTTTGIRMRSQSREFNSGANGVAQLPLVNTKK